MFIFSLLPLSKLYHSVHTKLLINIVAKHSWSQYSLELLILIIDISQGWIVMRKGHPALFPWESNSPRKGAPVLSWGWGSRTNLASAVREALPAIRVEEAPEWRPSGGSSETPSEGRKVGKPRWSWKGTSSFNTQPGISGNWKLSWITSGKVLKRKQIANQDVCDLKKNLIVSF